MSRTVYLSGGAREVVTATATAPPGVSLAGVTASLAVSGDLPTSWLTATVAVSGRTVSASVLLTSTVLPGPYDGESWLWARFAIPGGEDIIERVRSLRLA